jgi:transposase
MTQAKDFQNAVKQQEFHKIAGSPLLLDIISNLGVEAIFDEHAQSGEKQQVSNGQAGLALLLTRLLQPKALYKVSEWLSSTGVDIVLDHEAAAFTDDCLARMLDAISEQGEAIWLDLLRAVVEAYPQMLETVIQYDITSVYFEGRYRESELAQYGYSRDHRSDAKQVNLGVSTTGISKLPLLYELLAGNSADNQTPMAHLAQLEKLLKSIDAPMDHVILVGDRAMFNRPLIEAYLRQKQHFLGPWTPPDIQTLMAAVAHDELLANPLTYRPASVKDDEPAPYYGVMRSFEFVLAADDADPTSALQETLHVLVLYSRNKAKLDADKRQDHLDKLQAQLHDIASKLNQRRYKKACYVTERIHKCLKKYPAARSLIQWELTGEDSALALTVTLDIDALQNAQQLDGRYALVTNSFLSADDMLLAFKQQASVEHRFRILKDDLNIRPIHLRQDHRIQALILLTMIALVIYSILEWQIRQHTPRRKRPWTGRAILEVFENLMIGVTRFTDGSHLWHPPPFSDDQQFLWDAMGLPPLVQWLNNNCET